MRRAAPATFAPGWSRWRPVSRGPGPVWRDPRPARRWCSCPSTPLARVSWRTRRMKGGCRSPSSADVCGARPPSPHPYGSRSPMMMGYRPRVSQSFSTVSEAMLSDDAIDSVISWFAGNGRDLPWRHDVPPWAILVSEVMLQQTPVVRVLPQWTEWMRSEERSVGEEGGERRGRGEDEER